MNTDQNNANDENVDDDMGPLRVDIAERLAVLSEQTENPDEFDNIGGAFSPAEVSFETSAWMARIADVQGWLRFGVELPLTTPIGFTQALVEALGFDDEANAIEYLEASPSLTASALGRLFDRVDQARNMQEIFSAELEESGNIKAASEAWRNAWEDQPGSDEDEPLPPVSATTEVWPIQNFTDSALNLAPSYQRGDVWTAAARQLLIESILRGIPLPSVILLKPEQPGRPYEVVDGKQRLTAILRFVGKHPVALARVSEADAYHDQAGALLRAFDSDYPMFKKMWKALRHEPLTSKVEDEYFFPFKLGTNDAVFYGSLAALKGKYFTQITDHVVFVADEQRTVGEVFRKVVNYKIPVIEYKKATQAQIHEVFKLYNKQGVHLNAEEIRNAIYHEVPLMPATLVAAGDSQAVTREDVLNVAPALASVWGDVSHLGSTLTSYGFGESRYRRTKVLSWVLATLLGDTGGKDLPSTARHIDDLLKKAKGAFDKVDASPALNNPKLDDPRVIARLFKGVSEATRLHASYGDELWAPAFRDGVSGQKWQELQLIGSLVGITVAHMADPEHSEGRVEINAEKIFDESSTAIRGEDVSLWGRPKKTQTKTQWQFIARVAKRVVELLEVDAGMAAVVIRQQYGSSGVESLWAMATPIEK